MTWEINLQNFEHHELHFVFEGLVAQLALQRLPEKAIQFITLVAHSLRIHPRLQAFYMNESHGSSTFARTNKVILELLVVLLLIVTAIILDLL